MRLGARLIGDNSTFVHVRTGIDMVAGRGIPRRDPYSFTARGEPWVVQSWLPSWTYGLAHRIGGWGWVAAEHAVLYGVLGWLMATLARTGSARRTALTAGIAACVGAGYWSPRPLVFGLICFALVVMAFERAWPLWTLVPIGWVWVNSHGSFVLVVAWAGARLLGEALDRRPVSWRPTAVLGAGLLAGAVGPLGPKLLLFPFTVLDRREAFERIVEWQSPSFADARGAVTLLGLVGAVVVLARGRQRWTDLVPVAGLVAASLIAQRNLPVLAVALAPALGRALAAPAPAPVAGDQRRESLHGPMFGLIAVAAGVFVVAAATGAGIYLKGYPVRELRGAQGRVVTSDVAGGFLVLRDGRRANVFIDDRVDMYPVAVSKDYQALYDGRGSSLRILDRWRADTVVWEEKRPLATILAEAEDTWERASRRDGWVVYVRAAGR